LAGEEKANQSSTKQVGDPACPAMSQHRSFSPGLNPSEMRIPYPLRQAELARKSYDSGSDCTLSPNVRFVLDDIAAAFESLGDHRQSIQHAQRAIQKGYPLEQFVEQFADDPDMQSLLLDPNFQSRAK
jgi:hypothetical protein